MQCLSVKEESINSIWFIRRSWWVGLTSCIVLLLACIVVSDIKDDIILNWTEQKPAKEKADMVWMRITSNTEPMALGGLIELLARGFFLQTDNTERMTKRVMFRLLGKRKFIHTQGAYGRIKWKHVNNPLGYTGLLNSKENVEGIVAFSLGNRVGGALSNSWGLAVKLFRNNGPSAAAVLCSPTVSATQLLTTSFTGSLLDSPLCSHIDALTGALLLSIARRRPQVSKVDELWTKFGNGFGLSNLADITLSGEDVEVPNFPFAICLRAPEELAKQFRGLKRWKHPIEAARLFPTNTLLFEVLAIDSPSMLSDAANLNQRVVVIGEIWTESDFVSSLWGDTYMFFQHQKFEDDLALRPDWLPDMTVANLLMDGWAYITLYADRLKIPSKEVFFSTFSPDIVGLFQMLTNPLAKIRFLNEDIGISYIGQMLATSLGWVYGDEVPDENKQPSFRAVQKVLGDTISCLLSLTSADILQTKRTISPPPEETLRVEPSSDPSILSLEKEIGKEEIKETYDFATKIRNKIDYDGHYVHLRTMEGFWTALKEPVYRGFLVSLIDNYNVVFGLPFRTDLLFSMTGSSGSLLSSSPPVFAGVDNISLASISSALPLALDDLVAGMEPVLSVLPSLCPTGSLRNSGVSLLKVIEDLSVPFQRIGMLSVFGGDNVTAKGRWV